jgi:hypothetical protein
MNLFERIRKFFVGVEDGMRETSVSLIERELEEYENIFSLLTTGMFAGIPSPPTGIVLRILPYMQIEISVMMKKSKNLSDAFGDMAGMFDID